MDENWIKTMLFFNSPKIRKKGYYLVYLILIILYFGHLTSCATITRGTSEALVIETEPSGAEIQLSTGQTGTTPASFKVPRKETIVVTIKKKGYKTVTVTCNTQVSGAGGAGMAGNVFVGGLIGAAVDAGSGAMLEHRHNPVEVTLEPLNNSTQGIIFPKYKLLVDLKR